MRSTTTIPGLILFLFLSFPGFSQTVVVQETAITDGKPAILTTAIDPKRDEQYAIVTSDGAVITTTNSGSEWNSNQVAEVSGGSTWLFSDKKGVLYGLKLTNGEFASYSSSDLGESWKPLGVFSFEGMEGEPALGYHPDQGQLFLSYVKNEDCNTEVVFQKSKNTKKWSVPQTLNGKGIPCDDALVSPADVTLGYQGFIYAAWWQNDQIIMDRSFDNGDTWLRSDIKFKDVTGDFSFGRPRIGSDRSNGPLRGSIYTVWTLNEEETGKIMATRSQNHGDFWGPTVMASGDGSSMFPVIRIDQGNGIMYIGYWKKLEDGKYDIMLAFSIDGAQTFKRIKINDEPVNGSEESLRRSLAMSVWANRIIFAWATEEGGNRKVFAKITSYGEISDLEGEE